LVRRQNVQHDGRVGAVMLITDRKQKGRPESRPLACARTNSPTLVATCAVIRSGGRAL
jgi:hypothetical protein